MNELPHCHWRSFSIAFAIVFFSHICFSQVATTYLFSQYQSSYTRLTGATILETGTYSTYRDSIFQVTIPTFKFDGNNYTRMYISTAGNVAFSNAAAPSATNYFPLTLQDSIQGYIVAFGKPLHFGNTGSPSISWAVVGNDIVVQWDSVKRYGGAGSPTATESISFQIRLNTVTNTIKIVYDSVSGASTVTGGPQVGLRGPSINFATDINNRTASSSGSWASSQPGINNLSQMSFAPPHSDSGPDIRMDSCHLCFGIWFSAIGLYYHHCFIFMAFVGRAGVYLESSRCRSTGFKRRFCHG